MDRYGLGTRERSEARNTRKRERERERVEHTLVRELDEIRASHHLGKRRGGIVDREIAERSQQIARARITGTFTRGCLHATAKSKYVFPFDVLSFYLFV